MKADKNHNPVDNSELINSQPVTTPSFESLFTHAPLGYVLLDSKGIVSAINLAGARLLGQEQDELINHYFGEFISDDSKEDFVNFISCIFINNDIKKRCEIILATDEQHPLILCLESNVLPGTGFCGAVMLDVTEQKQTELKLQNNENQLSAFFEQAADTILIGNPKGIIVRANEQAFKLTGYTRDELVGSDIRILFSEKELTRVPLRYDKLNEGEVVKLERNLQRKDGSLVPIEMHTKTLSDRSYQTIIRDFSDRRRMEDALRASEQKFASAFRTSPDSININRASDGVYIEINDGFTNITGYTKEDVIGKSSLQGDLGLWVSDDDRNRMVEILRTDGKVTDFEAPFRMKDGTICYGLMSARLLEIDGEQCILSTTRDITARRKMEVSLKESEKSYRGILNTVSEAIYVISISGHFLDVNESAVRMYGYKQEEFIGQTLEFVSAPGLNNLELISEALIQAPEGHSEEFEFWGRRKNGEIFPKDVISVKGIYFGQEVVIATARDISERKKNEAALIEARNKAQESDRLKSAFLANMSHEIRSPMNSIVGFSELLDDDQLSKDQRDEFINIIKNSGRHLLTIINDIIDFAKIDSNQLTISPTHFQLNQLLEDIYHSTSIEKKLSGKDHVEIIIEKAFPDNNSTVYCDEVRLKQILLNLTGNAVKFTSRGFIRIGYKPDGEWITFSVQDTGKGIAQDKQELIFERFRQEEESTTRRYGGTGLGLSISKGLVELLGGKIWLNSEPDKGSTFFFTIPLSVWLGREKAKDEVALTGPDASFHGKTIIVAEDVESNFRLIRHLLVKSGAEVLHAENGKQVLEYCMSKPRIDLVLMDLQMPVMDGYEATSEIRKFLPGLPVIALTAFSYSNESEKLEISGFNDYLTKPIERHSMLELLSKYLIS